MPTARSPPTVSSVFCLLIGCCHPAPCRNIPDPLKSRQATYGLVLNTSWPSQVSVCHVDSLQVQVIFGVSTGREDLAYPCETTAVKLFHSATQHCRLHTASGSCLCFREVLCRGVRVRRRQLQPIWRCCGCSTEPGSIKQGGPGVTSKILNDPFLCLFLKGKSSFVCLLKSNNLQDKETAIQYRGRF